MEDIFLTDENGVARGTIRNAVSVVNETNGIDVFVDDADIIEIGDTIRVASSNQSSTVKSKNANSITLESIIQTANHKCLKAGEVLIIIPPKTI